MNQVNPFETKTVQEVLKELNVEAGKGLTDTEVKLRQGTIGLNEVSEEKQ